MDHAAGAPGAGPAPSDADRLRVWTSRAAAAGRRGRWQLSLAALCELAAEGVRPDTAVYNAAIAACATSSSWAAALSALDLDRMRSGTVRADVITYNSCITACCNGHRGAAASLLLEEMRARDLRADCATYGALISSCRGGRFWERALARLRELRELAVRPNAAVYNAAISTLERSHHWGRALALAAGMERGAVAPDAVTFNATMSGGRRWELAVHLRAEAEGVAPGEARSGPALGAISPAACQRWPWGRPPGESGKGSEARGSEEMWTWMR
ncbi:unnamed protein product [Prorocentrum cordatum]|uniref:Pentatricopeptide repeat-containing protein n=1 Tax=Prorocentrum cordatum TaxID=2364126 RepID=A0ABN9U0J1_9DINO|nr:unnamed protein product [Polarella glacialis]